MPEQFRIIRLVLVVDLNLVGTAGGAFFFFFFDRNSENSIKTRRGRRPPNVVQRVASLRTTQHGFRGLPEHPTQPAAQLMSWFVTHTYTVLDREKKNSVGAYYRLHGIGHPKEHRQSHDPSLPLLDSGSQFQRWHDPHPSVQQDGFPGEEQNILHATHREHAEWHQPQQKLHPLKHLGHQPPLFISATNAPSILIFTWSGSGAFY